MTNATLLNNIAQLQYAYKNHTCKLMIKINYAINCNKSTTDNIAANAIIKEIMQYYNGCSCLTEEQICNLITVAKSLLNGK